MTEELLWPGGPVVRQAAGVFPLGTDSILLAHFAAPGPRDRVLDLGTLCQKFCQQERVLAARESHEYLVIIFYQMISSHRLDEPLFQTVFKATALYRLISLLHADACPCSGQRDDRRPWRGSR